MKSTMLVILLGFITSAMLMAQEPFTKVRLFNRTVHEQDGHYLITVIDAPMRLYATTDSTILTSEYFPFILLTEEDTASTAFLLPIEGLSVFPNPTADLLFFQRAEGDDELHIEIYTTEGRKAMECRWPSGTITFQTSVSLLARGAYVMSITNERFTQGNRYKIVRL